MKRIAIIILFSLAKLIAFCQEDSIGSIIYEIDYLNVKGTFTKTGQLFQDADSLYFGILELKISKYLTHKKIGEDAFSYDNLIASYKTTEQSITIYYDSPIYLYLGKISFKDFLKENTIDGVIVPKDLLKLSGELPKIYCNKKKKSGPFGKEKLTNRCN